MSTVLRFDTPFSFEKSVAVLNEVVLHLSKGLNDDYARMLQSGDYHALVDCEIDYERGWLPVEIQKARQILAFFSKNASLPLNLDTKAIALEKFRKSEEKCRATNSRFRNRSKPFSQGGLDAGLIFQVQRKIADILGPFEGLDTLSFGFGPGSNVGLSRFTSVRRKLSARPTCTAAALKYIPYLEQCFPGWDMLHLATCTDYGKYATVPKNAKTDRSILVEPLVNSFLQKGVGDYIRKRLHSFGVDLDDQSINQRRAYIGSVTGRYATLDLASASDTISREVVKELLPFDWWVLLDDLRCHFVKFPSGEISYLQKFSSMGNGFTFELESLIFFAICSVVAGRDVSVYGDDLIVRTEYASAVTSALEHFGFEVNTSKSFVSGPFRESCGKDYFDGYDVRPCYVKDLLSVKELFRLHNFFHRQGDMEVAGLFLRHVPKRFLIFGPDGYGDGHLLGDYPKLRNRFLRERQYDGHYFRTFSTRPVQRFDMLRGDGQAFLYFATGTTRSDTARVVRRKAWKAVRFIHPHQLSWADDTPMSSRLMYFERGDTVYKLSRIYSLG